MIEEVRILKTKRGYAMSVLYEDGTRKIFRLKSFRDALNKQKKIYYASL